MADAAAAAMELLLAYAVASLSWRFIETPILKLKRNFQNSAESPQLGTEALHVTTAATAGN
jgi:peptidoglycan/LPS O-acetylase OafA/YrhL